MGTSHRKFAVALAVGAVALGGQSFAAAQEAVRTLLALQKDDQPGPVRLGAAKAVLEIGATQAEQAADIAAQSGFTSELRRDLAGRPRALILRLGLGK